MFYRYVFCMFMTVSIASAWSAEEFSLLFKNVSTQKLNVASSAHVKKETMQTGYEKLIFDKSSSPEKKEWKGVLHPNSCNFKIIRTESKEGDLFSIKDSGNNDFGTVTIKNGKLAVTIADTVVEGDGYIKLYTDNNNMFFIAIGNDESSVSALMQSMEYPGMQKQWVEVK